MAFSRSLSLIVAAMLSVTPTASHALQATIPVVASTNLSDLPAFGPCSGGQLSDTGQFLVMTCVSSDVVPGDDNDRYDTILKDLRSGAKTRVSLDASNQEVRNHSGRGIPSTDGRFVVFNAQGMFHPDVVWVPIGIGDATTNNVFLRDTVSQTTELLSRDVNGVGNPERVGATMRDADPARQDVLFSSPANYFGGPDVLPIFTNELFVRNWATGAVERISARPDGGQSMSSALLGVLGRNGRYVAFVSDATDLTADNPLGHSQIFLRDRVSQTTTRLTRPYHGGEFDRSPSISPIKGSANLDWILFGANLAVGFTPNDDARWARLYLLNRESGATELLSMDRASTPFDESVFNADISADGRIIAFFTRATNVLPTPNSATAIYVKDRLTGETINVSAPLGTSGTYIAGVDLSADGKRLAFDWRTNDSAQPAIDGRILVYTVDLTFGAPPRTSVEVPLLPRDMLLLLCAFFGIAGVLAVRRRCKDSGSCERRQTIHS